METAWMEVFVRVDEDGMVKIAARQGAQARVNLLTVPAMVYASNILIQ